MLKIHPSFFPLFEEQGLNKLDAMLARFVPDILPRRRNVMVTQDSISGRERVDVYFKLYFFRSPSWRFWGRPSKAAIEYRNYDILKRLGVTCAEPVACGEQRDVLGRLRRAFILTRAVPDSVTLEEFIPNLDREDDRRKRAVCRRQMLAQVADSLRQIHGAGFFHHDLVWRNILVKPRGENSWETCWIDCPRGAFTTSKRRRHRNRLRDLASFDKSAARWCPRGDRLRALLWYLGKSRLDDSAKTLVREVLEYRRKRWPDDWP